MITLPENARMLDYQRYVYDLEKMHGWLDVDLVHNCFLMGEEMGELFKAVRKHNRYFDQAEEVTSERGAAVAAVAEELVDVFNYLMAIANRLEIDMDQAFRDKNARNQERKWKSAGGA